MPVVINQVDTEVVVEGEGAPAAGGAEPPPAEVQVEALRAIIREILAEELARQIRRGLPP
jgi:hypothetical protein